MTGTLLQSAVKFIFSCSLSYTGEIEAAGNFLSTTIIVNSQGVKIATFYGFKYSHYFKVVEEGDKNIQAC